MSGEGTLQNHRDGTTYMGFFKDGEKNGQGSCTYPNGNRFIGEWYNNRPYKGELLMRSGERLFGEWQDEWFNGQGTISYPNGNSYEGAWQQNLPHDFGIMNYRDGSSYNG